MNKKEINIVSSIEKDYTAFVKKISPPKKALKNSIHAFWVGGTICLIAHFISKTLEYYNFSKEDAGVYTLSIMIFLGAIFTGIGVYDKIGKYAGAGSILPITGFANSIVSPAMEYKREGYVLGVAAKLFSLAGPVLVYGISLSVIVGIIYMIFGR